MKIFKRFSCFLNTPLKLTLGMMLMIGLVACNQSENEKASPSTKEPNPVKESNPEKEPAVEANIRVVGTPVAQQLDTPWDIEMPRPNEILLTERKGMIVYVKDGEKVRQTLDLTKNVWARGEAGLLDLVLLPNFNETNEGLIYHTYQENNQRFNRIVQVKRINNQWVEVKTILDRIPAGFIHNGGRMKIGPDNKLYVTVGDSGVQELAQDLNSLAGKILRMNLDGSIPQDNPFPNSYVYTYGHRNPQGLAWDQNGQLYSTEHGASAKDELNKIEPGKNYGWPVIEGDEQMQGMVTPLYNTGNETCAPSGVAIHRSEIYIACLAGQKMMRINLNTIERTDFNMQAGRIRDIKFVGDTLYYITSNRDGRGTPSEMDDQLVKWQPDRLE